LRKVNRRSVRCAGVTHEIVRMVEGWMVQECEAAAGRHLDRSRRRVRERAGRHRDCRGGGRGEIGEVIEGEFRLGRWGVRANFRQSHGAGPEFRRQVSGKGCHVSKLVSSLFLLTFTR
jgi:hypothetical protein